MSDGSSAKDAAWAALEAQAKADAGGRIAALFDAEPDRLQRLTLDAAGLFLDLSKHPWSRAGFDAALALARAGDVEGHRARLFAGEIVNRTEKSPGAAHGAARPRRRAYTAEGKPVSPEVEATRAQMQAFAEGVRAGRIVGATGKPFRTVVHIGIGGSDLGPKLVWEALKPLEPQIDLRFVANIDGAEIAAALAGLDPAQTMVIVVSKSFTTEETLVNGNAARAWLAATLGEEGANQHLAAVSANLEGPASSASPRTASSPSGTGSAGAIRCGRRWGSRPPSGWAGTYSRSCWRAARRWTSTSAPRRWRRAARRCWRWRTSSAATA